MLHRLLFILQDNNPSTNEQVRKPITCIENELFFHMALHDYFFDCCLSISRYLVSKLCENHFKHSLKLLNTILKQLLRYQDQPNVMERRITINLRCVTKALAPVGMTFIVFLWNKWSTDSYSHRLLLAFILSGTWLRFAGFITWKTL